MKRFRYFYEQLVTEAEMNDAFEAVQDMELSRTKELNETGVTSGLVVAPSSPISTSVIVSPGTGRIPSSGRRVANDISQPVTCDADEFGNPTYSDLGVGEGRWCSMYVRSILVDSDLRTDGHGFSIYYQETESLEFFLHRGTVGLIANKDSLGRPGSVSTAILLADIWFEDGSTDIAVGDLEVDRREDYFRQTINGLSVVAGNPRDGLLEVVNGIGNLSEANLPTGANDGAHRVGLGGHASQAEWAWANGSYVNASGNTVHDVMAKLVSDLGNLKTSGVSGASLVSVNTTAPTWYDGSFLGAVGGTYDGTTQGNLNALIGDLKDSVGADLIGSAGYTTAAYGLTGIDSVQGHLKEVIDNLNDHVVAGGHTSDVISYSGSAPTVFADGVSLGSGSVKGTFDNLVFLLGQTAPGASVAGTWKIGGSNVSATYGSKTVNITGGVSLVNQLTQLCDNIVAGVVVIGDDRLAGDFLPAVTNVSDLGDTTHTFAEIWSQQFKGSAISTLFRGEQTTTLSSGADLTIVTDSGPITVAANSGALELRSSGLATLKSSADAIRLDSFNGIVNFAKAGVDRLTWDDSDFYPTVTDSVDLGTYDHQWGNLYVNKIAYFGSSIQANGDITISDGELKVAGSTPFVSSRAYNACATASYENDPTAGSPLFNYALEGDSLAATQNSLLSYHPIEDMSPNKVLTELRVEWFPVTSPMICKLKSRVIGDTGGPVTHATITSTSYSKYIHNTSIVVVPVANQYFWIEVTYAGLSSAFYNYQVSFKESQWPR